MSNLLGKKEKAVNMSNGKCIIPVCAGSAEMNGTVFFQYVAQVKNFYKLTSAHLVLADTLDAHNMTSTPDDWELCRECAIAMGDRWIRKHFDQISEMFDGNLTIVRWDEVRADPTFEDKYALSKKLYETSREVKDYVDGICNNYVDMKVSRQEHQGHIANRAHMFKNSVSYMLEEIAGTSVYWNWYGAKAVYPGEYFMDATLFNRNNDIAPDTDLTVPTPYLIQESGEVAA